MTTLLNILLLVAVALSITGVVNRTRARLAGRRGPRFTQHLHNTALLLRKGAVYSTTTSALFRTAPALYLAAAVTALLFIPVGDLPPVVSFPGDLVCFIYLLALSRAALILAAMDTGSSFEGMGASREALYGALVEPALLLTTATLALMTGHTSFAAIFSAATPVEVRFTIILLLLGYLLTKIFIVEPCWPPTRCCWAARCTGGGPHRWPCCCRAWPSASSNRRRRATNSRATQPFCSPSPHSPR